MNVLGSRSGSSRGRRWLIACGKYQGGSSCLSGSAFLLLPIFCTCSEYGSAVTTGGCLGSVASPTCTWPLLSTIRLMRRSEEPNSVNWSLVLFDRFCTHARFDHVSCLRSKETK